MHILIIGQSGQLARALEAELAETVDITARFLSRANLDLSGSEVKLSEALADPIKHADAVIIAAAYTAVDAAENDYETALAVNGHAPGLIAGVAAKHDVPIVHISTDYVFSGDGSSPYTSDTPIAPINAYGRSKAAGEASVLSANPRACILRTSWVYDGTGKNFLTTMLRLAETRDTIGVVNDQIGRPTYARDLARASLAAAKALIERQAGASGIFHVSNTGAPISWADFAKAIFELSAHSLHHTVTVNGIPSSDYPTPAKRPRYSVMSTDSFEQRFDMNIPVWRDGLKRALNER